MSAEKVSDSTFEAEVLQSSKPVLVDFWAPWCGPCRAMSKVVDELAAGVGTNAKVVKINIDDAPDLAARYGVQSIPSFAVFVEGEVQDKVTGVVPKHKLQELLSPHLN